MKLIKLIRNAIFTALLLTIGIANAQSPPHPNGGNAPGSGSGNTPVGGGAPIGSGNFLLIGFAFLYATKKVAASLRIQNDNSIDNEIKA